VDVSVAVALGVGVSVGIGVGVSVAVAVGVSVAVAVGVGVGVLVAVAVDVAVAVGVGVDVLVGVGVGVLVAVGVGVGVTSRTITSSIVAPHGPPDVPVNVSRLVVPELAASELPSVVAVQSMLVGLPVEVNEKLLLKEPNCAVMLLSAGEPSHG
jgi:hypothetical protein